MKDTTVNTRERKPGFMGWVENLWFYHKWHILVGTLIIVFLGLGTAQCIGKEANDITILYVGDADIGGDREAIVEDFGYCAKDLGGNEAIDLSFAFMALNDNTTASRFNNEMLVGDYHIYIVTDEYFDKLLKANALAPISSVLGHTPDNCEGDGYGIRMKYLDIAETEGFDMIDRNSIICLRSNAENTADYFGGTDLYKNNFDLFKTLLRYTNDSNKRETVNIVCIGEQSLYTNTVYDLEYSVYNIGRKFDGTIVPLLNYEEQKILSNSQGVQIFGEEEQKNAAALSEGNKIMFVTEEVFKFLKESGRLAKLDTLGIKPIADGDEYGVKLSSIAAKDKIELTDTPGFMYLNKELYLCGTADIEGYTADMLGYLISWTEDN